MAQQGSDSRSSNTGSSIDSFLTSSTNFLSNFKYNNSSFHQQEEQLFGKQQQAMQHDQHISGNSFLSSSSMMSNNIRDWFSSKPNSSSNFFSSPQQQQSSNNNSLLLHPIVNPISRSLSDNSLPKSQFYPQQSNNNNFSLEEVSSKKKRKRCDEECEENDSSSPGGSDVMMMGEIDLMREAMILPNVDDMEDNNHHHNYNNNGEDSSSMFLPMFGHSNLMQFSLQHQSHNAFPLFESEEDMISSASSSLNGFGSTAASGKKKNRMSPQSHLIEFIRDNIMQYLLFHLKLDMRQTISGHNQNRTETVQLGIDTSSQLMDDVKMSDSTLTTTEGDSCLGVDQDVDITIPVGLLLDYIVQQAQRLYFNMYEYIRELASSSIKYHCKSTTDNQKEIELSLACNEFEKMVIEQVHFLLSQIQLMRSNVEQSSSSTNNNHSQIIPMLKKYDKILPKNFHTLRLVSSTSDDSIGSNADSFTLEGIVDESFLFKSNSPVDIQRSSFAHNFDDMKTNASLNDITSLLRNTKFNLFY